MPLYLAFIAPLALGIAVGVSAWLLAGSARDEDPAQAKECGNCGSFVREGWRLCPECGEFIDGSGGGGSSVPLEARVPE